MKELIARRLAGTRPAEPDVYRIPGLPGDLPPALARLRPGRVTPAAVLIPLLDREPGLSVLFTVRSHALKHHPGQVSFPGGRLEPDDQGPSEAALREAAEEIGLPAARVQVLGFLPNYLTITGYSVTPVVGVVEPAFEMVIDRTEVSEVFEVPLEYLFEAANVRSGHKRYMGLRLPYFEIPWGQHRIWGATAAMLMNFRDCVLERPR